MAIFPSFSVSQIVGFPSQIIITDTSTGTDGAIVGRRVYLKKEDGTFLVPVGTGTEYITWSILNLSITIDALDKDYSLVVIVQWLYVSNNILYDSSSLDGFTLFNHTFDYQTTQVLAGNQLLFNDNNFWWNKVKLLSYIKEGDDAIALASDQTTAQLCYDAATNLRTNSPYLFNANS
jgi:hypothetical protein